MFLGLVSALVCSCLVLSRLFLCLVLSNLVLSLLFSFVCLFFSCLFLSCLVLSCLLFCCLLFCSRLLCCLVFWCLVLSCLALSCLFLSCLLLGVVWVHFWSSWGSFEVIFGRLGGHFGLLGWCWSALRRSWAVWWAGDCTKGGGQSVWPPPSCPKRTALGPQKSDKTTPRCHPEAPRRSLRSAKTEPKTTKNR